MFFAGIARLRYPYTIIIHAKTKGKGVAVYARFRRGNDAMYDDDTRKTPVVFPRHWRRVIT